MVFVLFRLYSDEDQIPSPNNISVLHLKYIEIPYHPNQNDYHKIKKERKKKTRNAGEVEKQP